MELGNISISISISISPYYGSFTIVLQILMYTYTNTPEDLYCIGIIGNYSKTVYTIIQLDKEH